MASISKVIRRGTTRFRVFHDKRDRNGERQRSSRTFATFKDAQTYKRELEQMDEAGVMPRKQTVAQAIDEWLEYQKTSGEHRPETHDKYLHKARAIKNVIGTMTLSDLQPGDIEFLYSELGAGRGTISGKPFAHKTLNHVRAIMSGVVKTAVRHKTIGFDVVAAARFPKAPPRKRRPTWTPDEVVAYLEALDQEGEIGMVMRAIAMTGLRRSEVGALRVDDIDFERRRFTVSGSLGGSGVIHEPKTAKSKRRLPLTPDLERLFQNQIVRRKELQLKAGPGWVETGLLFVQADGTALNLGTLTTKARRVRDKAGLPKAQPLHGLRHWYATMAISSGVQPKHVSAMLGHSTVAFTMDVYCDVYDDDLADASALVQGVLRGRGEG